MTDPSVAAALSEDSIRQLEHFALMADLAGVDLFVSDAASGLFITCNASAQPAWGTAKRSCSPSPRKPWRPIPLMTPPGWARDDGT